MTKQCYVVMYDYCEIGDVPYNSEILDERVYLPKDAAIKAAKREARKTYKELTFHSYNVIELDLDGESNE